MTDIVERLRRRWPLPEQGAIGDLHEAANTIESLRSRAEKAEAERYQLALAICGGEDAPGYLDSIPVETIVDVARSNHSSHMNDIDRLMAAEATCEKLAKEIEELDNENNVLKESWNSDRRALKEAHAEISNLQSERLYVIGFNDGFDASSERNKEDKEGIKND